MISRVKQSTRHEIVLITPATAAEWLAKNKNFRRASDVRIGQYAHVMERDEWDLNGESIKFDHDGNLVDGQHRLAACVKSGKSFKSLVVWGVSPDNLDAGKPRTTGQFFGSKNIKNSSLAAAVCSNLHSIHERGCLVVESFRGVSRNYLTRSETLSFYDKNSDLIDDACVRANKLRGLARPALAATLFVLFAKKNYNEAAKFFDRLADSFGHAPGCPVSELRKRLVDNRAKGVSIQERETVGIFIEAWNRTRSGRSLSRFTFKPERVRDNSNGNVVGVRFPEFQEIK